MMRGGRSGGISFSVLINRMNRQYMPQGFLLGPQIRSLTTTRALCDICSYTSRTVKWPALRQTGPRWPRRALGGLFSGRRNRLFP